MRTTEILLVCCGLTAVASGQRESCTINQAGARGVCDSISQCPVLLRIARAARPNSPVVQQLRDLVRKCPRTAAGGMQICCPTDLQRTERPPRVELPTGSNCGQGFDPRVTGGVNATIGEFPWMASIQYANTPGAPLVHGCGATLITSRHVLTAAHCVSFLDTQEFPDRAPVSVVLGEVDFNGEIDCLIELPAECADKPISVEIDAIFPHPDFENLPELALPNDIAVVRLAREVRFTDFIQPVCLLRDFTELGGGLSDLSAGVNGMVAGWGRSEVSTEVGFTPVLQRARLPIREISECETVFRLSLPGRVCAGGGPNSTDTCRGDSGGPLMLSDRFGSKTFQIGVSSFGTSRCGSVAGYTRVFDYLDWIVEQINK